MTSTHLQPEDTAGVRGRRIGNRIQIDSDSGAFGPGAPALVNLQNVRPGMQVYDYDGMYVGFVTDVLDTALLLRRRWRAELEIPIEHVLAVLDQCVVLTVPLRPGERRRGPGR